MFILSTGHNGSLAKSQLVPCVAVLVLAITLAALDCGSVFAATLDFTSTPAGTLVSVGDPYSGILNIQAQGGVKLENLNRAFSFFWQESSIQNGALAVVPPSPPAGTEASPVLYESQLTATFLQPVAGVSFDAWCWRNAGYSYTGVDDGVAFSGSGTIPGRMDGGATGWATFSLNIPSDGYLTGFAISNWDPSPLDGAFWVNDISFAVVPEPATGLLLLIPILLGSVASAWRQRSGR
jgi:hypothetical protein